MAMQRLFILKQNILSRVSILRHTAELGDKRRPAAKCKVCTLLGGSNNASFNTTHLLWHFKKDEAE